MFVTAVRKTAPPVLMMSPFVITSVLHVECFARTLTMMIRPRKKMGKLFLVFSSHASEDFFFCCRLVEGLGLTEYQCNGRCTGTYTDIPGRRAAATGVGGSVVYSALLGVKA